MKLHTLDSFDFKNKTVLLRADLNSEVHKKRIINSPRIKESAKTIKELKKKGAKIVILAHQSRPGKKDFTRLRQHALLLSSYTKVKYIPDILGMKAKKAIKNLKPGEAILLENVRILKEEFYGGTKNRLVKTLAPLVDIYINDAFPVSHRAQTSITGFPEVLPSGVGRLMQSELEHLGRLKVKHALYILGGAKKENIKLLNRGNVITCGIFGQLCTIAKGKDLGAQNIFLKDQVKEVVPKLKNKVKNITTPLDFAVKVNGKRKELSLEEFPSEYEIFDIGPLTQREYIKKIQKAKVILMKGTAGFCEDKQFCRGTRALLWEIANSKALKVIAGGHASTAIEELKIPKSKFDYISLSGGAFVSYLAGEKLPGVEVLRKKNN